jgi:hypothetical protein
LVLAPAFETEPPLIVVCPPAALCTPGPELADCRLIVSFVSVVTPPFAV